MRFWSTLIEFIGAGVTAYGLFTAYSRTTRLPDRVREVWARIRRRRRHATAQIRTNLSATPTLTADVYAGFQLDEKRSLQLQLRQLESYVRELRSMFPRVQSDIAGLGRAIKAADAHAESVAAQALADARADLKQFGDQLDRTQAGDLRLAGVGACIAAVGIFLSFWA
jgi:hypothetical protein